MTGRIDRARVVDRAVIHPDDDVARRRRRPPLTLTGPIVRVDRDERARRVEPDADDRVRPRTGVAATRARTALTDGAPDVVRRLLDVVGRGLPDLDAVLAAADQRAVAS